MQNEIISQLEAEQRSLLKEREECIKATERDEQSHSATKNGRCHMATIEAELARVEEELRSARSKQLL